MPCPFCEAPLLGTPPSCPECGRRLPRPALAAKPTAVAYASNSKASSQSSSAQSPPVAAVMPTYASSRVARTELAPRVAPAIQPANAPALPELTQHFQNVGEVATEAVPGLIDARLFGAFVPQQLAVETVEGFETTAQITGAVEELPPLELMAANQIEVDAQQQGFFEGGVPDLIDSRLFGAFVPDAIDVAIVDGFETTRLDNSTPIRSAATAAKHSSVLYRCRECGVDTPSDRCLQCGAPTQRLEED